MAEIKPPKKPPKSPQKPSGAAEGSERVYGGELPDGRHIRVLRDAEGVLSAQVSTSRVRKFAGSPVELVELTTP